MRLFGFVPFLSLLFVLGCGGGSGVGIAPDPKINQSRLSAQLPDGFVQVDPATNGEFKEIRRNGTTVEVDRQGNSVRPKGGWQEGAQYDLITALGGRDQAYQITLTPRGTASLPPAAPDFTIYKFDSPLKDQVVPPDVVINFNIPDRLAATPLQCRVDGGAKSGFFERLSWLGYFFPDTPLSEGEHHVQVTAGQERFEFSFHADRNAVTQPYVRDNWMFNPSFLGAHIEVFKAPETLLRKVVGPDGQEVAIKHYTVVMGFSGAGSTVDAYLPTGKLPSGEYQFFVTYGYGREGTIRLRKQ